MSSEADLVMDGNKGAGSITKEGATLVGSLRLALTMAIEVVTSLIADKLIRENALARGKLVTFEATDAGLGVCITRDGVTLLTATKTSLTLGGFHCF